MSSEIPQTNEKKPPMRRWILGLCIFTAGGFVFNEISAGWFSSYAHFIAGSELVGWGLISLIGSIMSAIFYLIYGAISDNLRTKMGRRIPLILIGCLSSAVLTFLFTLGDNYWWLLIDAGILLAITRNMLSPGRSLTPDLIPQEKRGRVNTLLTIMTNVGSIIVWIPALILLPGGGENYSRETHIAFINAGAIILAATGIIVTLLIREPPVLEPTEKWTKALKKNLDWNEMKKQKDFLKLFVANLFLQAADSAIFTYLLPFIETVDFDMNQVIILGPIVGCVLGFGIYYMGKATDKVGRKKVAILGFLCAPFGSWFIALSNGNLVYLMIGFAIFFPFYLGGTTAVESWLQDILPKESRGKFYGLINITSAIGVGLGALLSGYLATRFNLFWIFVASAIILWTSIPFFMRVHETIHHEKKAIDTPAK
jgi:DHA1 family multidrug resistance protein-like MFS transporter